MTGAGDGTDPGAAAAALAAWLAERHGGPVTVAEQPASSGEGFDSVIHLVRFAGSTLPEPWRRPLVLRVKSGVDRHAEARHEADVHDWLVAAGYPAPRVLAVLAPGTVLDRPAQVIERAPGRLALDEVRRSPWRVGALVRRLARLHTDLHRLPTRGFPAGDDLLDRRLRLTRHVAEAAGDDDLRRGLERVERLAGRLRHAEPAVCHGDFHPLNVMVAGDTATVIDWTDAGIGDRHGDLARTLVLFDVAAVAATNPAERALLRAAGPRLGRGYRRAYERELAVDGHRLALWAPVHLLHGWSQAVSLHADPAGTGDDHDDRRRRVPAAMIGALRLRFHAAMAAAEATGT